MCGLGLATQNFKKTKQNRMNAAADINSMLDLLLLGHVYKAHLAWSDPVKPVS